MTHYKVKTFDDLGKLELRLKPEIQVTKAGGFYKARWRGSANFVFGETSAQALERLKTSPKLSLRDTPFNLKRRESNWATGFREGK